MIYSLSQIQELRGKTVLLDANILLFMHCTKEEDKERAKLYTKGIAKLKGFEIKMVVTPTILSEFFNRSLRQDRDFHQNEFLSPKLFRNSDIGQKCIEAICVDIRQILHFSELVMDTVTSDDVIDLLKTGKLDFGDALSILTARKHDYVIFTDDIDFKNAKVPVLTGNPKYFR